MGPGPELDALVHRAVHGKDPVLSCMRENNMNAHDRALEAIEQAALILEFIEPPRPEIGNLPPAVRQLLVVMADYQRTVDTEGLHGSGILQWVVDLEPMLFQLHKERPELIRIYYQQRYDAGAEAASIIHYRLTVEGLVAADRIRTERE